VSQPFLDCNIDQGGMVGVVVDPEFVAAGRGETDLFGYCGALVETSYTGPVNLEIIGASQNDVSCSAIIAAESAGYLRAVLRANSEV
jgi:sugar phosphate isomerase/epimerase